jgi:manganese oxidase
MAVGRYFGFVVRCGRRRPALWVAGAAFVALAGLVGAALAQSDDAWTPTKVFHLYATDGEHRTADGATVYVWGYSLSDVPGTATLPGPTIEVDEGDRVEIVLTNIGPSRPGVQRVVHTIHLHGLDVDQANDGVPETSVTARVGQSITYRFTATHAGTYWYHCHVETVDHLTMGMYGALVVHPRTGPGRAWTDGPSYDRAHTLLLSELDPTWNEAIGAGRGVDRTRYDPRYFFINGRSFPDTMLAPDTHVVGVLGERVLLRLINAGYGWRSMHLHGFHFEVVATDGRPLAHPYLKDTLSIGPGERYDLLVTLDQLGSYPFHSHVLLDNLNDGTYPGGIHTMVKVVAPGEPVWPPPTHAGHVGAVAAPPATAPSVAGDPAAPAGAGHGAHAGAAAPAVPADPAADDPWASAVDGATVLMYADRFAPDLLVVPVGTTVTWLKRDEIGQTHAVVGPGFESPDIRGAGSWQHTFDAVGVFEYECPHHIDMIGIIRVVAADAAP